MASDNCMMGEQRDGITALPQVTKKPPMSCGLLIIRQQR